jgi:hypothetical protein
MTIRLLHQVANDPQGAVLTVSEDRAKRLIWTGYAEEVQATPEPRRKGSNR